MLFLMFHFSFTCFCTPVLPSALYRVVKILRQKLQILRT